LKNNTNEQTYCTLDLNPQDSPPKNLKACSKGPDFQSTEDKGKLHKMMSGNASRPGKPYGAVKFICRAQKYHNKVHLLKNSLVIA